MKYFIIWLCCLVPLSLKAKTERVVDGRSGVVIVFVLETNMFPTSWKQKMVNAQAYPLKTKEIERSTNIIVKALSKYPKSLLQKYLKKIYILHHLECYGKRFGGTNSNDCIYITNQGYKKGYTSRYIEQLFHAEFSSILLQQNPHLFNFKKWKKVNADEVQYDNNGVNVMYKGHTCEKLDSNYHKLGFLNQYATSTLENDFNAFAKNLFRDQANFWYVCFKNPRLKQKLRLIVAFYKKLNPQFTMRYFRKLSLQ